MLNKIMSKYMCFNLVVVFLLSACNSVPSSKLAEMAQVAKPNTVDQKDDTKQHLSEDACAGIENCTVVVPCEDNPHAAVCSHTPLAPEIPGGDAYASHE
ncbi:hypothetical protein CDG68_18040 [Acinetobacter wuhouensis]|uniref:Secreted protein n=2 Tax=Acinetobacter wuhouensis TaxID=1879050 RepID=A0A3G2T7H5_9GAMM|nr:hypothetical protein CDG68_18040 [Acinetobacter wuhouensis]